MEILLGAAWCESVAGDPARGAALLDQAASLVADPDDTIVAEMAHAEMTSLARQGRFTECEAVAERGGAAARRAGRPDLAFSIWLVTACALSVAGDMAGALRAADAAVVATVVDLARPPIVGLVEPEWELRGLTTELAELDELTEVS